MFGAFDNVIHHQPIGKVHLFMGAKSICCEILIVRRAIDRKGSAAMIESDYVFFIDGAHRTDFNPGSHSMLLLQFANEARTIRFTGCGNDIQPPH
jgi:hypothetical protein